MKGYADMGVYQKIAESLGKFVDSTRSFFVNTADEMKKSSWPTRDQVLFKAVKYLTTF